MNYRSILIITYARSGSTLLQGVLNSIDECLIRGENDNVCFHLFESYLALVHIKTREGLPDAPTVPWFGKSVVDEHNFLCHMKTMLKELLLADKLHDETIRCYGFKEIRYLEVMDSFFDYLEFLKRIFPEVAFIFNTRNLDDVVKSAWFAEEEPGELKKRLLTLQSMFSQYCDRHENGFQISYEDVVSKSKRLKEMFEFLGVDYEPQKIDKVLALPHSYKPSQKHIQKNIFGLHGILDNIPAWSEAYQKEKNNKVVLEKLIGGRRRLCEHYIRTPGREFRKELESTKEAYFALKRSGMIEQPLPQEEQDFLNGILAQDCSHPKYLQYLVALLLYCLPHQLPPKWRSQLSVPDTYEEAAGKSKRLEGMFEFLGVHYEPQRIDTVLSLPHSHGPGQEQKKIFRLHGILDNIPAWSEAYQQDKNNKVVLEILTRSRRSLCEHYLRIPGHELQKALEASKEAYFALMRSGMKAQPLPQEEQDFLNGILAQDCSHPKNLQYLVVLLLYCLPHQLPPKWRSHLSVPKWASAYLYAWLNKGRIPEGQDTFPQRLWKVVDGIEIEGVPPYFELPPIIGENNDYSFLEEQRVEFVQSGQPYRLGVSIVIPVYNQKGKLAKTLAALTHQSYPGKLIEVVVADAGSSDGVEEVIEKYQHYLSLKYVRQENKGYRVSAARNLGTGAARYEYIALLDCDMLPVPEYIELLMQYFHVSDRAVLIGHRRFVCTDMLSDDRILEDINAVLDLPDVMPCDERDRPEPGEAVMDPRLKSYTQNNYLKEDIFSSLCAFYACCVAYPKKVIQEVGPFDEDFQAWGCEDTEMGYRLYNAGYYFIPVLKAVALHQEPSEKARETDREQGRVLASEILEQKCPVPIFRTYRANVIYEVPKVSFYMAAYNAEKYIKIAVDSVLAQTYTDLEVCIVNDGSTDNTLEILEKNYTNNPRVRWITQKNSGVANTFNAAVNMCRGMYIAHLDADDMLLRLDAVEIMVRYLDTHNVGLVYSSKCIIDENGQFSRRFADWPKFFREKLINGMIVHHFRMFRKRDWARLEYGFDESLENAEDFDFFIRLSEVCSFHHTREVLYGYRWHGENVSVVHNERQIKHHHVTIQRALKRNGMDKEWEAYVPDPDKPRKTIFRRKNGGDTERGSSLNDTLADITIVIKTFLRPRALERLLHDIKKYYPTMKVYVADDSKNPQVRDDVDEYFVLPFDSGVSYGRNYLIDRVKTKYVMLLDDDTVFTENTKIEWALEVFKRSHKIDLVAGRYLPYVFHGTFSIENDSLMRNIGCARAIIDGFPIFDFVPNFFVAKTEKIQKIRWNEKLKIQEHTDFFWRARKELNCTYLPYFMSINSHTEGSEGTDYPKYREERATYFQALQAHEIGVSAIVSKEMQENFEENQLHSIAYKQPDTGHPQEYIFIVSHMRSYSTLLAHILGSHSDISGYLEAHVSYSHPHDLLALKQKVSDSTGHQVFGRFVLDKVLDPNLKISDSVLNDERVRIIFLLRNPGDTIKSILNMGINLGGKMEWCQDVEKVVPYYMKKLQQIEEYSLRLKHRALCIESEKLLDDSERVFRAIEDFLGLKEKLRQEYSIFKHTGLLGRGDPSPVIKKGEIIHRKNSYNFHIPAEMLTQAQKFYEHCRSILLKHSE